MDGITRWWTWLAVAALVMSGSGCATFSQSYVAVAKGEDQNVYYRITVDGCSLWSTSKYQSGIVNAADVDRLYGEKEAILGYGGPKDGEGAAQTAADQAKAAAAKAEVEADEMELIDPATGKLRSKRKLVMVLSEDASIIFAQLKTQATNREISGIIAAMASKQSIDEAAVTQAERDEAGAKAKLWITMLGQKQSELVNPDNKDPLATLLSLKGYLGGGSQ